MITCTVCDYSEHVGERVIVMTTYRMVYTGELTAADGNSVMVRVDTKTESKHYDIAVEHIRKLTVLGPAITAR